MKLLGKKKSINAEIYQPLFSDSIDYRVYRLSAAERLGCLVAGAAGGFILGEIFYGVIPLALVFAAAGAAASMPFWRAHRIKKRSNELKTQFRDMLEAVATSIGSGQNVTDSFLSAYGDMRLQYSDDAYIVKELRNIVGGMNNNISIETLLDDFATRSGLDDARSFASVFETSYRRGGDIKGVVKSTYEVINEKIEIDLEIQTMVASSGAELKMMLFMPVVIILMLRLLGGDMLGQGTMMSMVSTTVALAVIAGSYVLGKKMMDIRL